jgi:hypothetical protein
MPKYILEDTGGEVTAKKAPAAPAGWDKFSIDLTQIIGKLLEYGFWLFIGFLIGYISRG